jgi:hypothetical protein
MKSCTPKKANVPVRLGIGPTDPYEISAISMCYESNLFLVECCHFDTGISDPKRIGFTDYRFMWDMTEPEEMQ